MSEKIDRASAIKQIVSAADSSGRTIDRTVLTQKNKPNDLGEYLRSLNMVELDTLITKASNAQTRGF